LDLFGKQLNNFKLCRYLYTCESQFGKLLLVLLLPDFLWRCWGPATRMEQLRKWMDGTIHSLGNGINDCLWVRTSKFRTNYNPGPIFYSFIIFNFLVRNPTIGNKIIRENGFSKYGHPTIFYHKDGKFGRLLVGPLLTWTILGQFFKRAN